MSSTVNPPNDKVTRRLKIVITLVCLLFFGVACIFGVKAYQGIVEANQSLDWPTVPGKVFRSGIDVSVHKERATDRERRDRETRSYSASIEYEFEVDGTTFHGSRITVVSDQFGSKAWAETTVKNFPVGKDVSVSYNPENPEQCVLEPGRWGGIGFMLIVAGIFGLFPPLVVKAIWSTKPLETGFHPETRDQRILQGVEFRERIIAWQPGQLVHLQRDSISIMSVVGGAIIAGLVAGVLFGFVPALVFFSGRGPIFIGQCYLGASAICALVCTGWLWLDNRPRETRIDWATQSIHLAVGSHLRDAFFSDVQQFNLTIPQPRKPHPESTQHHTTEYSLRINMVVNGRTYIVLEKQCVASAIRSFRSKLSSIARQLASPMNVLFVEDDRRP